MTEDLFRADAYLKDCTATVMAIDEHGIVLDRTVFYPLGGGQAGDSGVLVLADGSELKISDTRKGKDAEGRPTNAICHLPEAGQDDLLTKLKPGDAVTAKVDWQRRHKLMRFHTTTHLLCHLVPQLVNGCSITPDYARLDFNMTDPLEKEALSEGIARLENLILEGRPAMPLVAIKTRIAQTFNLVVHMERRRIGNRWVRQLGEVLQVRAFDLSSQTYHFETIPNQEIQ